MVAIFSKGECSWTQ